ncbi:transposase [Orrella marina]|uniref:transposase n=1 Tax=Orrella marina TaxID=2163011 RepID=UPI001D131F06|nr:transposase [Orrella marina]
MKAGRSFAGNSSTRRVRAGGFVVAVAPRYASQTCSCCGHESKGNRQTQARFVCVGWDFEGKADLVGAINILVRGHRVLACAESVQSGPSIKQEFTEASLTIGQSEVGIAVLLGRR